MFYVSTLVKTTDYKYKDSDYEKSSGDITCILEYFGPEVY